MKEWSEHHHHIGEQWRLFRDIAILAVLLALLLTLLSGSFNKAHSEHYQQNLTPQKLAALIDDVIADFHNERPMSAETRAALKEQSRLTGVTDEAMVHFLDILKHEQTPLKNLDYQLHQLIHRHFNLIDRLRDGPPEKPQIQALLNKSAEAVEQGNYPHAEKFLVEVEEKAAKIGIPMIVSETLEKRGELHYSQFDYARAADLFSAAAAAIFIKGEKSGARKFIDEGIAINLMTQAGQAYFESGQYSQAERYLKQAITLRERAWPAETPELATTLTNLAWLYETTERFKEAEKFYERALAIFTETLGEDNPMTQAAGNSLKDLQNRTMTW